MHIPRQLEQALDEIGDLPALPAVAREVMQLTEDPAMEVSDLCHVMEKDPALTAKILRISNSPYYGMRQSVGTLKLALVILGVREVRNIILGISVIEALRDEKTEALLGPDFWIHSMQAASLARRLATRFRLVMQGEAFVAGLLHDIGKLVFGRYFAKRYGTIYRGAKSDPEQLCSLETDAFGFSHAELGAALGTRWNFPQALTDGLLFHHPRPDLRLDQAKDPQLAAVVRLANRMARIRPEESETQQREKSEEPEAWAQFGSQLPSLTDQDRQSLVTELILDLNGSPLPIF